MKPRHDGHVMDVPTDEMLRSHLTEILCAVVTPSSARPPEDRVAHALCCFLVRCSHTWRSIDILWQHARETFAIDAASLVRAMLDAYLQAAFIFHDPARRAERAALYLDYEPVERYRVEAKAMSHDKPLIRNLKKSPHRVEGERRLKEEFDKVKDRYFLRTRKNGTLKIGPGVRHFWYEGSLRDLARIAGSTALAEYDFFVTQYNGAVHSSAMAVRKGPIISDRGLLHLASCFVARIGKMNVEHNGICQSDLHRGILDALARSPLGE